MAGKWLRYSLIIYAGLLLAGSVVSRPCRPAQAAQALPPPRTSILPPQRWRWGSPHWGAEPQTPAAHDTSTHTPNACTANPPHAATRLWPLAQVLNAPPRNAAAPVGRGAAHRAARDTLAGHALAKPTAAGPSLIN